MMKPIDMTGFAKRNTGRADKRASSSDIMLTCLTLFTLASLSLLLILLTAVHPAYADNISVLAGRPYYAELYAESQTINWAGLRVINNEVDLDDSDIPFMSLALTSPVISVIEFPGANLNDELHYYGAMMPTSFSMDNILNASPSDLLSGGMFNQYNFSVFYPNYNQKNDNPNFTFCCNQSYVTIAGVNYTAMSVVLDFGIDYYVLKYNDSGTMQPLFLSEFRDALCYNNTPCVAQFILPLSDDSYSFYVISQVPVYEYRIFVDGVETGIISQTALPYNVTVEVTNTYTGLLAPNLYIAIGEEDGQNLFIPYRLEGYISEAYAVGRTDINGRESFLIAPTVYPSHDNYTMFVSILQGGRLSNIEEIVINSRDTVVQQSKPLHPTILYDNAKVSVNAMNQISNYLFKWSSELQQAKTFTARYFINTDSWIITDNVGGTGTLYLKTGAPNAITVTVWNGITRLYNYTARIKEHDGYLVMSPYTGSSPLTETDRNHLLELSTGTEFIVTPTSLGSITSNITLEIIDINGDVVAEYVAPIDNSLGYGGTSYNNDLLKTIVNAINVVLNSLFYSLNY